MQEYQNFVHKIIILEPIDFYHNTLVCWEFSAIHYTNLQFQSGVMIREILMHLST